MSYEDYIDSIEYSDEEVRDMEIMENAERECGLTPPKWEQELIEEVIVENYVREGHYPEYV